MHLPNAQRSAPDLILVYLREFSADLKLAKSGNRFSFSSQIYVSANASRELVGFFQSKIEI